MLFGKTVDIRYNSHGAYAVCSYKGNEEFLNNLFDEIRKMPVSDDPNTPAYFLEPIIRKYFKRFAYRDFIHFLSFNGIYSDGYFKGLVTNPQYRTELCRVSAVICSYKFD